MHGKPVVIETILRMQRDIAKKHQELLSSITNKEQASLVSALDYQV
jgi:hypothetical protein